MIRTVLTLALATTLGLTGYAQENAFTTKWDNGFKVDSKDGRFKLRFGGRLMYDIAYFSQDDAVETAFGEMRSGNEFRRARFFNSGTIYGNVNYKFEVDFAGGEVSVKDAFVELTSIPVAGNLRVGHFKEPLRLEVLTSSRYIMFMERSFHVPFSPERNTGLMIYNDALDGRLGWQLGVFRNADGSADDTDAGKDYNITARIAGRPYVNADGSRFVHLGAALSSRSPKGDKYSVSSRASSHLAPKYVATGTITDVSNVLLFNAEASAVFGPFSIEGEWLTANVDGPGAAELSFGTYYAQVSYFLTGEHRVYKSFSDGYDRVKPKANVGDGAGGPGALEVAARYTSIDLDDRGVFGGEMNEFTIGVNWYLNPATRIMANYVRADIRDLGNVGIFQTRFQVDF